MTGYTGLSFPFRIGPKGGVVTSSTSDMEIPHILESIQQILLTRKGERVNEPEFGTNLYQVLFENIDETMVNVVAYKIQEALEQWEPRIEITDIIVRDIDGGIEVILDFVVIRTRFETSTSVLLQKEAN